MTRALIIIGCALALAVLAATQSQFIPGNLTVAGNIADPGGTNWIKEAPINGVKFVRQNGLWVAAPGGIEEAPINGTPHVRVDGIWAEAQVYLAPVGHNHAGVYEPTFSKGSLVAGTGIGLSGTLASRLVGGGDITVSLGSHSHSASDITLGTLPIARGGTGGPDAPTARGNLNVPTRTGGDASGTWGISITGDAGTLDGIDSTGFATSGHNHSGVYEPVFSKGDLVAGSGTTLTGTLTGRLVGSGNVTITSTGTGVTDHGALTGLGDDDHTQYHTDARGDARYLRLTGGTVSGLTTFSAGLIAQAANASSVHSVAVYDSDPTTSGTALRSRSLASFKTALGSMPPDTHNHVIADVSGLQTALDAKAPTSRTISTTHSLTGGGDLSADRTLSLVGDTSTPGSSRYYGTDGSGTRGWHALPSASGDSPFAYASFTDPGGTPTTPSDCTVIAGSSSGIYGVYRADQGLYRIDLLASQPTSQFKRVEIATVASSFYMWMGTVISNATHQTKGTNVFVAITQAASTSNLETAVPTMIRIYSH